MILPEIVSDYLAVISDGGFEAYVVGGAVRDSLLNEKCFDYDVTTNARPEQIKEIFQNYKTIDTGIKHGTVTVLYKGRAFETTTFRLDGDYNDNRHPEKVTFTEDIVSDLSRRDFTVNAMAFSPEKGLIDPFGGQEDLKNGVIRTVGEPEKRFKEDALRILRAVRFAAKTGFTIEDNTFSAMITNRSLLKSVSVERIFDELSKTLAGKHVFSALEKCKDILFEIVPELKATDGFDQLNPAHLYDVFIHTLHALEYIERKSPATCWAALLHDVGKPLTLVIDKNGLGHFPGHMERSAEISRAILKRFKAPNHLIDRVATIVSVHDKVFDTEYEVKKFINRYGFDAFDDFLTLTFADIYAHSDLAIKKHLPEREKIKKYFKKIIDGGECCTLSQLAINGDDLIKTGYRGSVIGDILNELLDKVMSGQIENDKEKLVCYLKENY